MADWAGDLPLVTAWHPDLDYRQVKRLQDRLFNSNNPGRPKKKRLGETKRRTSLHQPKAFWLHGTAAFSFGELAELFDADKNEAFRRWEQRKKRRR